MHTVFPYPFICPWPLLQSWLTTFICYWRDRLRLKTWFWPWTDLRWSPDSGSWAVTWNHTGQILILSQVQGPAKKRHLCCWDHRHGANLSGHSWEASLLTTQRNQVHLKVCSAWGTCSNMLREGTGYLIFQENTAARPQLLPKASLHLCPLLKY